MSQIVPNTPCPSEAACRDQIGDQRIGSRGDRGNPEAKQRNERDETGKARHPENQGQRRCAREQAEHDHRLAPQPIGQIAGQRLRRQSNRELNGKDDRDCPVHGEWQTYSKVSTNGGCRTTVFWHWRLARTVSSGLELSLAWHAPTHEAGVERRRFGYL
jgi:hypothetical protein